MRRRPNTKGRRARRGLSTVHADAAGIDVGSRFHVVAVGGDRDAEPVRTFSSFTHELHRLADWLAAVGISTVAMESTGVYWIPLFEILEARGFEVLWTEAPAQQAKLMQLLNPLGIIDVGLASRDVLHMTGVDQGVS